MLPLLFNQTAWAAVHVNKVCWPVNKTYIALQYSTSFPFWDNSQIRWFVSQEVPCCYNRVENLQNILDK